MSEPEQTQDQRVAKLLGAHPDQVRAARDEWNVNSSANFIRATISDRLQRQIDERMNKLKTVDSGSLCRIQGEVKALELAINLACQYPLTNE